jgi:hypothetical protein
VLPREAEDLRTCESLRKVLACLSFR